nr:sensor histidine kinase [uncultured Draconibacterium sp.]
MINLVFCNLLSNAIKFTRQGGLIRIRIYEQDDYILTEIADNGVGISRDVADKLFTKNQFHSTYGTNNEKGTDLGLALCKDFVQRNNGTIGVESTSGKGSKFTFIVSANK